MRKLGRAHLPVVKVEVLLPAGADSQAAQVDGQVRPACREVHHFPRTLHALQRPSRRRELGGRDVCNPAGGGGGRCAPSQCGSIRIATLPRC